MSDDNLEALSNADLRSKCLQYGLPNVPITDSSRNVLIKKLRVSMGGSPAAAAGQKKTSRRETIHNSKPIEVVEPPVVEKEKNVVTNRTNTRRTVAGTPTGGTGGQTVVDAKVSQEKESSIPAPIGTRRRSSAREPEKPPQKVITATRHPTIILESDDDDDELVLAAEEAEKISVVPSRPLDAVSLSKSTVVTTSSLAQKTATPTVASAYTQKKISEIYSVDAKNKQSNPLDKYIFPLSQQPLTGVRDLPLDLHTEHTIYSQPSSTISTSRFTLDSSASRIGGLGIGGGAGVGIKDASSYYSPSLRYSTSSGATSLRSKVSSLYNEQSDDTEGNADDEPYQTPFLSNFARNLERIKTEPIAAEGHYRNYKPYEITGRRPKNDSLKQSLLQLWLALDKKYNVKRYVLIFLIFCLLAIVYVIFFQ